MIIALLIFVLFFVCCALLFLSDSLEVSSYDNIHQILKQGERFKYNELIKLLGYPTSKKQTKEGLRCSFIAHSTGSPFRNLVIYLDENDNYIKHTYSVGFETID